MGIRSQDLLDSILPLHSRLSFFPYILMATNVGPTLGTAQLAATLSGVPFAAGGVMVLQMINATCSQVAVHKVNHLWDVVDLC